MKSSKLWPCQIGLEQDSNFSVQPQIPYELSAWLGSGDLGQLAESVTPILDVSLYLAKISK